MVFYHFRTPVRHPKGGLHSRTFQLEGIKNRDRDIDTNTYEKYIVRCNLQYKKIGNTMLARDGKVKCQTVSRPPKGVFQWGYHVWKATCLLLTIFLGLMPPLLVLSAYPTISTMSGFEIQFSMLPSKMGNLSICPPQSHNSMVGWNSIILFLLYDR